MIIRIERFVRKENCLSIQRSKLGIDTIPNRIMIRDGVELKPFLYYGIQLKNDEIVGWKYRNEDEEILVFNN